MASDLDGCVRHGRHRGQAPDQPLSPSYRGWTKIRRRDTTEAIVGAVTGTPARPQLLVLGRHDQAGRLRAAGHPWTGAPASRWRWGSRDVLDVILVRPELVAEISPDRAVDHGGVYRHPLCFKRLRLDVTVGDVAPFGAGPAAADDTDVQVHWDPPPVPWSWTAQVTLATGNEPSLLATEG